MNWTEDALAELLAEWTENFQHTPLEVARAILSGNALEKRYSNTLGVLWTRPLTDAKPPIF